MINMNIKHSAATTGAPNNKPSFSTIAKSNGGVMINVNIKHSATTACVLNSTPSFSTNADHEPCSATQSTALKLETVVDHTRLGSCELMLGSSDSLPLNTRNASNNYCNTGKILFYMDISEGSRWNNRLHKVHISATF